MTGLLRQEAGSRVQRYARENVMFEFFFRKKKPAESTAPTATQSLADGERAAAPGTAIRYDPELIDKLKRDHRDLLSAFGSIKNSFESGNLQSVVEQLDAFRVGIQSHLLTETVRLYIYLEHQLAGDETSRRLIHDFRHEMDGIGKTVVAFLAKYKHLGANANLAASFAQDLDAVGKILVDRIRREEEVLYPLYASAY
jgi:hypothetical protein